jgi:hypothetical protein
MQSCKAQALVDRYMLSWPEIGSDLVHWIPIWQSRTHASNRRRWAATASGGARWRVAAQTRCWAGGLSLTRGLHQDEAREITQPTGARTRAYGQRSRWMARKGGRRRWRISIATNTTPSQVKVHQHLATINSIANMLFIIGQRKT